MNPKTLIQQLLLCYILIFGQALAARTDTSPEKKIRLELQVGNISFNGPVYLDSLKLQEKVVMVDTGSSARKELSSYRILSYSFILITASGPKKISITGNSFSGVKNLLHEALPGDYVMISDIRCQTPKGDIICPANLSAQLK